ncbi:MAG: DUF1868 domain-containing protein [Spirochaetes bacterium]|nr:DUF1868 domain-containing protein [Spirochaetota bacterium]
MTDKIYTSAVGKKFNHDGSFRKYPGITIISKIKKGSFESTVLKEQQSHFMKLPFADKFAFLPQESFHMTVFDLLKDQDRKKEDWSEFLKLDSPLNEIDNFMKIKFNEVKKPNKIKMKVKGCYITDFICVDLEPFSEKEFNKLKFYRDALSDKSGIKKPNHDTYKYHITLAHKIIELDQKEKLDAVCFLDKINDKFISDLPFIELGVPELCFFNDLSGFYSEINR